MMLKTKKSRKLLLIIIFIFPFMLNSSFLFLNLNFEYNLKNEKSNYLNSSQIGDNFTITALFPKVIFIEGELFLNITSNQTAQINCTFSSIGSYFTNFNRTINLIGNNISQEIFIISKPHLSTFPGVYQFLLNITGDFVYSEQFEAILSMGYTFLIIISIILITSIIYVIMHHKKSKQSKKGDELISRVDEQGDSTIIVGRIKCPECNKLIEEGLAFCPECGSRIPEFLRFNPN